YVTGVQTCALPIFSHMLTRSSFTALLLTASVPVLAQAQEAATTTDAVTPDEEIVVTGRAGAGERTKLDTSYAVTTLSNEMIRSRAPSSMTETLKSVPGFWVEDRKSARLNSRHVEISYAVFCLKKKKKQKQKQESEHT